MEGEISMISCVKRRRPSLQPEQQPHATSLVDQPEATPAESDTTVERSSNFRGVSRYLCFYILVVAYALAKLL